MENRKESCQFKTEINQLMKIIIHSLYSHPEIFLRELISNASDALDKLRFRSQLEPDILGTDTEFKIVIKADGSSRTLEVSDNGIGMTYDEVVENIGTIAKSGTAAFAEAMKDANKYDSLTPELIGQFGVGFYSSFIVAEKVTLITKAAGSDKGVKWESSGDGSYTIEETEKASRGTSVLLKLKNVEKDEQDFAEEWTIRSVVKKHSDFVAYPIVMDVKKTKPVLDAEGKPDPEKTETVVEEEVLNSMKAIWVKDKAEVSEEEYNEFYSHISHDWNPPHSHLHLKLEGTTEYSALLYIPAKLPFDFFMHERKHGINLYCKRVFIMENCTDLMPPYLAFIKGVVDAPDLNLNVSREILQQNALVRNIKTNLVKKLLDMFAGMEKEKYESFYGEFGHILKSGISADFENREKIASLLRYKTTKSDGQWVSLQEYISRMKPDQEEIYYITGDNLTMLLNSPHLEQLKEKDYEVLLMTDPIDEWVIRDLHEFEKKRFRSAEKGDLDLGGIDDKKKEIYSALFAYLKSSLEEKIKAVKPSTHLKDSIACLSGDSYDMSAFMEKILKANGQEVPQIKRVLELNVDHPLLVKIRAIYEQDSDAPVLKDYSNFLYDLAVISEGGKLDNPSLFSKMIGDLMTNSGSD
ncbi:molecular chaperone HtpG [Syntrophus gentianae]|uniref:Chaperone protein HtpG n=1 Tax=Syntrophus gentianae TaxID=43775 RepID=A0A1H7WMN2_9BACT|nr:molecular chaperone HtpG [Syntrophus gentianae]SEM22574.1 molecular chaperone HtpG [Syntrophus gentianae]